MPRRPRLVIPDVPIHITQRGVDRCATFISDDDFALYLWVLRDACVRARCAIHAYALMTNHVHLLLTPADSDAPACLMRALGLRYVRYFNDRYRRTGTLWEGRFRSTIVDTSRYFLACSRYIERNPVRAGIVDDPGAYAWSSYRRNAYGENDGIVTPHSLYTALGTDAATRRAAYRELFAANIPSMVLPEIRTAPRGRHMLGTASYRQAVATIYRGDLPDSSVGIHAVPPSLGGSVNEHASDIRAKENAEVNDPLHDAAGCEHNG
jgi:putative transposase